MDSLICSRRAALAALTAMAAWPAAARQRPRLTPAESQAFRSWFAALMELMVGRGPSPRWTHRDCAGLIRFATREAFAAHDARWLQVMGWPPEHRRPPEVGLSGEDAARYTRWTLPDGSRADYAGALALVQGNTRALGRDAANVLAGDLLFFDQGSDQHLMAWTGRRIVYHTGAEPMPDDNGLRSTTLAALARHPDTRWRPGAGNPNFAGWFRFDFLAP